MANGRPPLHPPWQVAVVDIEGGRRVRALWSGDSFAEAVEQYDRFRAELPGEEVALCQGARLVRYSSRPY